MKAKTEKSEPKVSKTIPPVDAGRMERIAPDKIGIGKTNPRKEFPEGPMKELTDSIRTHGVIQPLLVRPLPVWEISEPDMVQKTWQLKSKDKPPQIREFDPGKHGEDLAKKFLKEYNEFGFELVCGERRYRAAIAAKLPEVPCLVKNLTDEQVLAIQLIENDQREDLSDLERALGYKRLQEELHYTIEQICEAVGRKRTVVFATMAMLKLSEPVKKALQEGTISASVAQLIGRYCPGERLQKKALEVMGKERAGQFTDPNTREWVREAVSARQAEAVLRGQFALDLKGAKFDVTGTYAGAPVFDGPCAGCTQRSGNCRDEFPEIKSPDVCMRAECYHGKARLHQETVLRKAAASGQEVVSAQELKGLFNSWGGVSNSKGFLEADDNIDTTKGYKSLQELFKKKMPPAVVAVNPAGKLVKLYRKEAVELALKEAGIKLVRDEKPATPEDRAKAELEGNIERETMWRGAGLVADAAEKEAGSANGLAAVLRLIVMDEHESGGHAVEKLLERRGIKAAVGPGVKGLKGPELAGLLLEMECRTCYGTNSDRVKSLSKVFKVDLKALQEKVREEMTPKTEGVAQKGAKKGKVGK